MTVYVDDCRLTFWGMKMSHMTADTIDELHIMADRIGLKREWFQPKSHPHYDVSDSKRRIAIVFGAIPESIMEGARRRMMGKQIKDEK